MPEFQVGDRVYYAENGVDDTGTVVRITDEGKFVVKWDDGQITENDVYMIGKVIK